MNAYIVFIVGCVLMVAGAGLIGFICGKIGVSRDDDEQAEYLRKYSEAKRAQKDVPIFLRKQAD